ncbi:BRISC and BRCA1-A complex member 1-like [Dermacentor silvarum]|uniref:BRISC and BRCA1-A complex member 1-like n=1 Tax=Dermacentor silvarum TaxID=543639 RepID=UPI001896C4FF|nr:BRISC and BRCA1-A complex member 1-like [Dermacentor silvarum]
MAAARESEFDFGLESTEESTLLAARTGAGAMESAPTTSQVVHVKVPSRLDDSEEDSGSSSPRDLWDAVKIDLAQAGSDSDNVVNDSRISRGPSVDRENVPVERTLPRMNCPERIVICVDLCSEMEDMPFTFSDGSKQSPLFMIKRVIELFVHNKHKIDKRHEFALVVFHEVPLWIRNFTNDPKEISNFLEDLNETRHCESCDLTGLFDAITEHTHIPEVGREGPFPPPFLVRTILIYGRSNSVPQVHSNLQMLKQMMHSLYFFLDILYVHEPLSEANCCQEIFNAFVALDDQLQSYMFEVSRNATKLHNCMAKLLAHPLQRPQQHIAHYKLKADESPS